MNPLSPNIHIQILQTDLHTFPWRISWENLIKDQRFFPCDHFINSHRLCSWRSMDIVRRKLCLVTIGMTFDAKERLMNVACIIRMYGVKHTQKTLGWRSVTWGYHGSKISGLHQSFLTETVICIVKRWKKLMGYRLVPECNHAQESHTCHFFVVFFLSYLQDHGLLRSRNFSTMATWRNDFFLLTAGWN